MDLQLSQIDPMSDNISSNIVIHCISTGCIRIPADTEQKLSLFIKIQEVLFK